MPIYCTSCCRAPFVDICYPADPGETLPDGTRLPDMTGVAITGSALHVYRRRAR